MPRRSRVCLVPVSREAVRRFYATARWLADTAATPGCTGKYARRAMREAAESFSGEVLYYLLNRIRRLP